MRVSSSASAAKAPPHECVDPATHKVAIGEVRLPGSKSISNRALLLAALAKGDSRILNLLDSEDTRLMRRALQALGVSMAQQDDAWLVKGVGGPLVNDDRKAELNLGLAGTALRPLTAALTLGRGEFVLDGNRRMRERPIGHLVDALNRLDADIGYVGEAGYPPVRVRGRGLAGGATQIDGSLSSQFLTALLLAAPLAREPVQVDVVGTLVSKPYIDITLDLMARFGAPVGNENYRRFIVANGGYRSCGDYLVEGDASSASYFLAAGAIAGQGVRVHGVGRDSIQGDVAFADVLASMGARVERRATSIAVRPGRLVGIAVDLNQIPDAAMTIAVLALFAKGPNAHRQRRQLAHQGNRPPGRHGPGTAQAGRQRGRRVGLLDHRLAGPPCKQPPSTPTATTAWPCASP